MAKIDHATFGTKKILVAGGAGFLGSHLCDQLIARGHRVYCLDNLETGRECNLQSLKRESRFSLHIGDICDPIPASMKVDMVYNLACAASPKHYQAEPIHTLMTSVLGTRNLLEHARANRARLLQASTSEVYGDPEQHPQVEAYWGNVNPTGPRACYDEGKRAGEALCFDYIRCHGTDVRVARIFNTYGPRMRADDGRIVSNFVVQAVTGQPLTIYGSGEQTRSFCYVSDLIAGLMALADVETNPGNPVNLGNPMEYSISEVASLVLAMTGSASPIVHQPLPVDDPRRRRPDIGHARRVLGWTPKTNLGQGLPATIAWFAKRVESPVREMALADSARPTPVPRVPALETVPS